MIHFYILFYCFSWSLNRKTIHILAWIFRISIGQRTKTGQYFHYNITSHSSPFLEKARSILFMWPMGEKFKVTKQSYHIISLEPISKRLTSNSVHDLSMTSVWIDVFCAFCLAPNCKGLSESNVESPLSMTNHRFAPGQLVHSAAS